MNVFLIEEKPSVGVGIDEQPQIVSAAPMSSIWPKHFIRYSDSVPATAVVCDEVATHFGIAIVAGGYGNAKQSVKSG
jgi:hypothetical protein